MKPNRFNFRAYIKAINKLVDVEILHHEYIQDYKGNLYTTYELMQSTGLVDKNGKEIFEGDFLKDDETGDILNVQWREDGACFGVSINENWQDYDWRDFGELDMYDLESLEIIGNEYENPDCWRKLEENEN